MATRVVHEWDDGDDGYPVHTHARGANFNGNGLMPFVFLAVITTLGLIVVTLIAPPTMALGLKVAIGTAFVFAVIAKDETADASTQASA